MANVLMVGAIMFPVLYNRFGSCLDGCVCGFCSLQVVVDALLTASYKKGARDQGPCPTHVSGSCRDGSVCDNVCLQVVVGALLTALPQIANVLMALRGRVRLSNRPFRLLLRWLCVRFLRQQIVMSSL